MKTTNFWRTLLFTVMAAAAFTACSDDDNNESTPVNPKITVDGLKTTSVGVKLEGIAKTTAVVVESTGEWTLAFANATDATWCEPSVMGGGKGTSSLSFKVAANATERQATITLTTYGKVAGISQPIPATATIVVKQNDSGSTEVKTNVAEVRAAVTALSPTKDGVEITADLNLTAIVISDVVAGGTGGNKSCYVVDNSTEAGHGIIVRFNNAYSFKVGDVITGSLKGGKAVSYFGVLQVTPASDSNFTAVSGVSEDVAPIQVAVADLANYESQLVKVVDVQPSTAARGQVYCPADAANYQTSIFQTKTGGELQISVYKTNKWAQTTTIPSKSGFMVGIVTVNNSVGQVAPRNAGDVAGLTENLFDVVESPAIAAVGAVSFAAAGETKTVAFTASNIPAGNNIYAKVTGTDAAAFPVATGVQTSPISITVAANSGAAKVATLRIYAAPSENGAEVAGVNVALSQAAPGAAGEKTTTIVMKEYSTFSAVGTGNVSAGTVMVAPFSLVFDQSTGSNPPKYYGTANNESVRMYAANTLTISGATITKIEFTFTSPYDGAKYNNLLTTTGAISTDSDTQQTWTGSATNVVFNVNPNKVDGKNLQARIMSVKITYAE